MDKKFWGIVVAIILVFVGIALFTGNKDNTGNNSANGQPTYHIEGEGQKRVTLVEYGDFQCPACRQYHPVIKQVVEKYKQDITFQFRHYPLTQIHPNAFAASRAAEAASKQNKFWEMHDLLYQNQDAWAQAGNPQSIFEQYAKQLGMNIEQFKTDFTSDAVNSAINADMKEGTKLNITGTPSFFINLNKVESPSPSVESFSKLIEDASKNPAQ